MKPLIVLCFFISNAAFAVTPSPRPCANLTVCKDDLQILIDNKKRADDFADDNIAKKRAQINVTPSPSPSP